MSEHPIRFELREPVAILHWDDGKANAVSPAVLDALHGALDRAEKEAQAVALVGRPGRFCAGFDLGVMREGGDAMRSLVHGGAELLLRLVESPLPIVAGCTGHALAMGALVLLASDLRLAARGDFKLGLNEVAIGMTLPAFAVELARERLDARHLGRAALLAELYTPEDAIAAGFLDRTVPAERLVEEVTTEATRLAALPRRAFTGTRRLLRGGLVDRIRATLAEDMAAWNAPD